MDFGSLLTTGLGYDNTEICFRAIELGYRLLIDDSNIAKCINIWGEVGGTFAKYFKQRKNAKSTTV
ncbi:MAG: hypothetical protein KatS3mg101_0962 [Patescibacteria group bacterium]|nr:MAG: hypothetical protein KatS3mg101_0962 [Patescibacteria group bacterium]